jgi:hypothetical protein
LQYPYRLLGGKSGESIKELFLPKDGSENKKGGG